MVLKLLKTIRNNWKKSVFFTLAGAYGVNYCNELYRESVIRQEYCREAQKYGRQPLRPGEKPRKITVFLNPAAQKGKGKKIFEKNVAPILYLAGLEVTVVKTEYEGQAKKYMDVIEDTDAIIVAGGDGTLCEIITGLLRRSDINKVEKIPIGVIPVGATNTLAKSLACKGESTAKWMAELGMSVVKCTTRHVDVMCVESEEGKNIYAVNNLKWGHYQNAEKRKSKYWYLAGLKHRWTYLMSTFVSWPPNVHADMTYVLPCKGCSTCFVPPAPILWKWWHFFIPPRKHVPTTDYSNIINPECGQRHSVPVNSIEFTAQTQNHLKSLKEHGTEKNNENETTSLKINIGPNDISKTDFIKEGWNRVRNSKTEEMDTVLNAGSFELLPNVKEGEETWFTIDNEQFEAMKIKVSLLKDKLQFFCPPAEPSSTSSS